MSSVVDQIRSIAEAAAASIGVELVKVEYKRAGRRFVVRVVINREGGTGIQDCERISRALGSELEALDVIPGSYSLEVMSRGIRP